MWPSAQLDLLREGDVGELAVEEVNGGVLAVVVFVTFVERAAAGQGRPRLAQPHPGRLGQRDQRYLRLQPLDLRLGMCATLPSGRKFCPPEVTH